LGEGPVWDSRTSCLYFSNASGRGIYKLFENGHVEVLSATVHASNLTLHENGGLVYVGSDGVSILTTDLNHQAIVSESDGNKLSKLNEIIADVNGRIYCGDECYKEGADYETGFLYRIDTGRTVSVVDDGFHLANGMGFSPTSDVFYVVDSVLHTIYAYDYDRFSGDIKNKRKLISIPKQDGLPDGMAIDNEGFIWVALWFGSAIMRFDPEGKLERKIKLPFTQPTSLCFGGKEMNEIFITSGAMKWKSKLAPVGYNYDQFAGGMVYKLKQEIVGKPEYMAKLS
jgi:sugar lactone lactonase YvrE